MKPLPFLYFFGIAQLIFLLPKLFSENHIKHLKNRLLISTLFCLSIICYVYASNVLRIRPDFMINLTEVFWFAVSPLLYLYTRSLLDNTFQLQKKHGLFFLFSIYNLIQYIFISLGIEFTFRSLIDSMYMYTLLFIAAYLLHIFLFTGLALQAILSSIKKYKHSFSESQIDVLWLRNYFILFIIINFLFTVHLVSTIIFENYHARFEYLLVLYFEIFIITISYKMVNHPEFILPNKELSYVNSPLTPDELKQNIDLIHHVMDVEKIYLDKSLSLADVSTITQLSENKLSQTFSQGLNTNFYDFVNQYRIEEAKKRLRNPLYAHFKIQSIAEDSGFNSKASFYRIFKKECKMTPSEYMSAEF
jgi:AraC-like DNA-binding protein